MIAGHVIRYILPQLGPVPVMQPRHVLLNGKPQLVTIRVMLARYVGFVPHTASYPIMHAMIKMEFIRRIRNVIIAWYVQ